MERFCLIIDDNPQQANLDLLIRKGKELDILISGDYFDPSECIKEVMVNKDGKPTPKFELDFEQLKNRISETYNGQAIHLIACDYDLGDEKINGFDIISFLSPIRRNSLILLYSGNERQIVQDILNNFNNGRETDIEQKLLNLIRTRITAFRQRNQYVDYIIELFRRNEPSLELILEGKLLEHPDMIFQNTYEQFSGRTLKEIAHEIRQNSHHGQKFKIELIERAVSHMIELNDE